VTVHKASGGTYGAHRVPAELKHGGGIKVGHSAVELIMRQLGIKGLPTRRLPKGARVGKEVDTCVAVPAWICEALDGRSRYGLSRCRTTTAGHT
jgi:hypothetical protein